MIVINPWLIVALLDEVGIAQEHDEIDDLLVSVDFVVEANARMLINRFVVPYYAKFRPEYRDKIKESLRFALVNHTCPQMAKQANCHISVKEHLSKFNLDRIWDASEVYFDMPPDSYSFYRLVWDVLFSGERLVIDDISKYEIIPQLDENLYGKYRESSDS